MSRDCREPRGLCWMRCQTPVCLGLLEPPLLVALGATVVECKTGVTRLGSQRLDPCHGPAAESIELAASSTNVELVVVAGRPALRESCFSRSGTVFLGVSLGGRGHTSGCALPRKCQIMRWGGLFPWRGCCEWWCHAPHKAEGVFRSFPLEAQYPVGRVRTCKVRTRLRACG